MCRRCVCARAHECVCENAHRILLPRLPQVPPGGNRDLVASGRPRLFVPGPGQRGVGSAAHTPARARVPRARREPAARTPPPRPAAAALSAGTRDSGPRPAAAGAQTYGNRDGERGAHRAAASSALPVPGPARGKPPRRSRPERVPRDAPATHQHHRAPHGLRHALPELSRRAGLAESLGEFAHFGHDGGRRSRRACSVPRAQTATAAAAPCLSAGRPAPEPCGAHRPSRGSSLVSSFPPARAR